MTLEDAVIVGAGPAGLAAALQLRRFGLSPRIFECRKAGGLLHNAHLVENYPGFPDGISGSALAELFVKQAHRAGVSPTFDTVRSVKYVQSDTVFFVETEKEQLRARVLVLASGTVPETFPEGVVVPDAAPQVFYEIERLGPLSGKQIAIIGGGDAAFDYALHLAKDNHVCILNRSAKRRCLPLLFERALADSRISYFPDAIVFRVERNREGALLLRGVLPEEIGEKPFNYLLGALGRKPRFDYLGAGIRECEEELRNRGVLHMIGDLVGGRNRQTAIAVGSGIHAAMCIESRLKEVAN